MEVHSVVAREAIERDLSRYADQWRLLQEEEVEAPYGPIEPELDDIQELRPKGTWIPDVTLGAGRDGIEATWTGHFWQNIVEGDAVVISRTHPRIDEPRTCTVARKSRGRLELRAGLPDVDIETSTWRLDLEVNYDPYHRVSMALYHFTSLSPPSSPSPEDAAPTDETAPTDADGETATTAPPTDDDETSPRA